MHLGLTLAPSLAVARLAATARMLGASVDPLAGVSIIMPGVPLVLRIDVQAAAPAPRLARLDGRAHGLAHLDVLTVVAALVP